MPNRVPREVYRFTFKLKLEEITLDIEDRLFEAGCADSGLYFSKGMVYLEFFRESDSLRNALVSALDDVNRAGIKVLEISKL